MNYTAQDLSTHFRSWLKSQNYSSSTTRNYLVDINKYLSHLSDTSESTTLSSIFSLSSLKTYLDLIEDQKYKSRALSSLNKFSLFALSQKYISSNPIKKYRRLSQSTPNQDLQKILSDYKEHLIKKNRSPSTVKNYLNDLQQYINWLSTT